MTDLLNADGCSCTDCTHAATVTAERKAARERAEMRVTGVAREQRAIDPLEGKRRAEAMRGTA